MVAQEGQTFSKIFLTICFSFRDSFNLYCVLYNSSNFSSVLRICLLH